MTEKNLEIKQIAPSAYEVYEGEDFYYVWYDIRKSIWQCGCLFYVRSVRPRTCKHIQAVVAFLKDHGETK